MITGRMSAAEDALVILLAEKGWKAGRIAMKLDRHKGTINWAMYRLGLKAPTESRRESYSRNGSICWPMRIDW